MSVFAMNGFGDLQSFCEIREADLDYMGIMAPEQRAKILAAVQVMHDYQCKSGFSHVQIRRRATRRRFQFAILFTTAPEDDSSSTEENKTDPSCDDSQDGGQRAVSAADLAKPKPTPKPRFSLDNGNDDAPSPDHGRKTQKPAADGRQRFGEASNATVTAAKLNSCTSSEKSTDSGVSSSSSVCFGNTARGKRSGADQLNSKNNFGGHLAQQNVKD